MDLKQHQLDSQRVKKENIRFFKQLKKVKPKVLDNYIHAIHEETFSCIDCLLCANCCSTTGPLFSDKDISRIENISERDLRILPNNSYASMKTMIMFYNLSLVLF